MIAHQRASIITNLRNQNLHPIHEGIGVNVKVNNQYIVYLHIRDRNDIAIQRKVEAACEGLHYVDAQPVSYKQGDQVVAEYWVFLSDMEEQCP